MGNKEIVQGLPVGTRFTYQGKEFSIIEPLEDWESCVIYAVNEKAEICTFLKKDTDICDVKLATT